MSTHASSCKADGVSHFPIPPITLAAGLAGQHLLAGRRPSTPASAAGAALLAGASGWFLMGSLREFLREHTSFDPVDVSAPTSLVVRGPNAVTRNPMYLGMAGLLLAHAGLRRSRAALLPMAVFVLVIDRVQIPAEEAALAASFGDDYTLYRGAVPRWVGTGSLAALGAQMPRGPGGRLDGDQP